jgi:hypothetical protein
LVFTALLGVTFRKRFEFEWIMFFMSICSVQILAFQHSAKKKIMGLISVYGVLGYGIEKNQALLNFFFARIV